LETKAQIRKRHIQKRSELTVANAHALSIDISRKILEYIAEIPDLKERGIYGYYPLGREVELLTLYAWLLSEGYKLAFPKVHGDEMFFYEIHSLEDFEKGTFGVMEPKEYCRQVEWEQGLCLVPGSVFDEQGNRYGYGKGYYDKYFQLHKEMIRLGIAYEMQIEKVIPVEESDVKMHGIVTERRYINLK